MVDSRPKTRRHFTEAARRAAALARKAKQEQPRRFGEPELFVVRARETARAYAWQIRRFGGVVLATAGTDFPDPAAALEAGRRALSSQNL